MAATRKRRTYVVELEGDLHRRLRKLARNSGLSPEQIIASAVRWYVMEADEEADAPENEESRPAGC